MFVPVGGHGGLRPPLTLNLPGSLNVAIKIKTMGVAMKVAKNMKMRIGRGAGHMMVMVATSLSNVLFQSRPFAFSFDSAETNLNTCK